MEWACSFPIEMQTLPCWLTGRLIDDIEHGEHLQAFEKVIAEFIDVSEKQETINSPNTPLQADILRNAGNGEASGTFKPSTAQKA